MEKVYVRTNLAETENITPGKVYEAIRDSRYPEKAANTTLDDGENAFILFKGCAFLGGKDWEIVESHNTGVTNPDKTNEEGKKEMNLVEILVNHFEKWPEESNGAISQDGSGKINFLSFRNERDAAIIAGCNNETWPGAYWHYYEDNDGPKRLDLASDFETTVVTEEMFVAEKQKQEHLGVSVQVGEVYVVKMPHIERGEKVKVKVLSLATTKSAPDAEPKVAALLRVVIDDCTMGQLYGALVTGFEREYILHDKDKEEHIEEMRAVFDELVNDSILANVREKDMEVLFGKLYDAGFKKPEEV